MPGLFGLWKCKPVQDSEQLKQVLNLQASSMCRHDEYYIDFEVFNNRCGLGRIHVGILDQQKQPLLSTDGRYALFMDGEFYNQSDLCSRFLGQSCWAGTDAELALAIYQETEWEWIRDVNGQFALAVYDKETGRLQLVMDRFGLHPHYMHEDIHGVSFAPEVKAIIADGSVSCKVDPLALREFFTFGYLLEDRTWIKGIRLLPSASITTIDDSGIRSETYWSWDDIHRESALELEDAAEELGMLWIQAVRRRIDGKRIGLTLSGGLDSRSVLAAIPKSYKPLHAITFGVPNCDDYRLAHRAAMVKGAEHHFFPISEDNWPRHRPEAVWWTDGHLGLMDMHGVHTLDAIRKYYDVNLHAFAGDLIMGGSYLQESFLNNVPANLASEIYRNMRIKNRLFAEGILFDHLAAIAGRYSTTDAFFLQNRVRRFTLNGPLMLNAYIFDRKVVHDNNLAAFCYSLPDEFRYQSMVYKKMLLKYFPELYKTIPWQKTGLPISASNSRYRFHNFIGRVESKVRHEASKRGIYLSGRQRNYSDYDRWTRTEPGRSLIITMLSSRNALWQDYLPTDSARRLVQDHMNGSSLDAQGVLLLLTFEIWLQRLHRDDLSENIEIDKSGILM